MFYVGQKVVVIDDSVDGHGQAPPFAKGDIVTVLGRQYYVRLLEVEGHWKPDRFRPIVSRPTDITVFEKLLDMTGAGVEA